MRYTIDAASSAKPYGASFFLFYAAGSAIAVSIGFIAILNVLHFVESAEQYIGEWRPELHSR